MKVKRHYIYRMVNDTTGEFYIGKRSCTGEPSADVKYMGSGVVIKNKVKAHPEQWRKEILCFASSPEQLNQAEIWAIGTQWIDNRLCLNLTPGGDGKTEWTEEEREAMSKRLKEVQGTPEARATWSAWWKNYYKSNENRAAFYKKRFTPEARAAQGEKTKRYFACEGVRETHSQRAKEQWASKEARTILSERAKKRWSSKEHRDKHGTFMQEFFKINLISTEGEKVEIDRNLLLSYLQAGYTFALPKVCVKNDVLGQWCRYSGKKAVALLLSDCGWTYGQNSAYTQVGMAQVEASRAGTGTA